jgi:hypothetical protein
LKISVAIAVLLLAAAADAAISARASLIGSHLIPTTSGSSLLICEYSGERAKFEILSQNGKCARYIDVQ